MNEQKLKHIRSHTRHKPPQRRVSFSKPWTPTNWSSRYELSRRGSKDKAHPVPSVNTSRSILAKPSLRLDKSQSTSKGVCARIKKRDVSSSTTVDTQRRSQSDPTPTHLKYGMFRKFSRLKNQPSIIDGSPPSSPKRRTSEMRPIPLARSRTCRQESSVNVVELPALKRSIASARIAPLPPPAPPPPPPPRPHTKHVNLSYTEPMHLDIKPKKFPSMLWC